MPKKHSGGCSCGAIRYRISGQPLFVHACHCTDCQIRSGSAFGLTMFITEDQLQLSQGTPRLKSFRGESGVEKTARFCAQCGAHLWNSNKNSPGLFGLRPGSLDDRGWFTVGAHIWTESKQPWLRLDATIPAFQRSYSRAELWPAASQARLPV